MENSKTNTTIQVSKEFQEYIKSKKIIDRESYESTIKRLIKKSE